MPPENSELGRWFSAHILPHEPILRSWLKNRFPSGVDVDDVIQESYLRVLKAREKSSLKTPKAFLFATARNFALNVIRYQTLRGDDAKGGIAEVVDAAADVRESVQRDQELALLAKAIESLPKRCRQILTLHKVYGMPRKEIAESLGLSLHTVNKQITIGFKKCAAFMDRHCHIDESRRALA